MRVDLDLRPEAPEFTSCEESSCWRAMDEVKCGIVIDVSVCTSTSISIASVSLSRELLFRESLYH